MMSGLTKLGLSLDKIPVALTTTQKSAIRTLFASKCLARSDAEALIVGWRVIRDVAGQHALRNNLLDFTAYLMSPPVRKRRDRQLGQGVAAADRAIASLRKVLETVGKHSQTIDAEDDFKAYCSFEAWIDSVISHLELTKHGIESYRAAAKGAPIVHARRGTREWLAETCLLEVLAAYFRRMKWRVSQSQTGTFAETALILLPNRGTGRFSMNPTRLIRLARSKRDFPDLDAIAPSVR
jgi:hypothetical protein